MIKVTRVYWYTDWLHGIRLAFKEMWRAFFGCHHKWSTIRFMHTPPPAKGEWGVWFVNECSKCGETRANAWWGP